VDYTGTNYPVNFVVNWFERYPFQVIGSVHDKVLDVVKSK